jgi:hypothetical protein
MVIFVPVLWGYLVWKDHSKPALARSLAWLAIPALMIAPWLAREEHVHHRFVWMTTRGGITFFDGNYLPISKSRVMAAARNQGLDEAGMDRFFFKVTLEYLKKHPGHYFKSSFRRLRVLLDLKTYDGMGAFVLTPLLEPGGNFRSALAFLAYYMFLASRLVMVLGLIGAILGWKRFPEFFLVYAVPLMIILFHFALFLGKPRYLAPAYPSLCIFSALVVERLTKAGRLGPKDKDV